MKREKNSAGHGKENTRIKLIDAERIARTRFEQWKLRTIAEYEQIYSKNGSAANPDVRLYAEDVK